MRSDYLIGISFVGGPDYLRRALASIGEKHLEHVAVINSSEPEQRQNLCNDEWNEYVPVVPLSHTQSVNYIFRLGANCDAVFMVHNDAECEPDTIDKLLAMLPTLPDKWSTVFTLYDCVAMYNPRALAEVGPWDWRLFPSYYSDPDWYRRCRLAGWWMIESHLPVKHEGSHIINKVDKRAKYLNHMLLSNFAREAYIRKWGGPPGEETYTKEFNGELENPYPDA